VKIGPAIGRPGRYRALADFTMGGQRYGPASSDAEQLVDLVTQRLRILGQPVRLRLIEELYGCGEASVQALAKQLEVTPYNASQHLGVLRQADVVARRQRGREALYRLADPSAMVVYEHVADGLAHQARALQRRMDKEPDA
jgi:DNA-binding transcriptional ArsR family regulator